jgi:predicted amidophosphoribosyltransferase
MKKQIHKVCRACETNPAVLNAYCPECMKKIREEKRAREKMDKYWMAVEFGSGDLWR